MQRIINDPDNIVDEMLEGFLKTHSDLVERSENGRVVKSIHMEPGRTGVVTGGGSGHKPAFIGYVGEGMWLILLSVRSRMRWENRFSIMEVGKDTGI